MEHQIIGRELIPWTYVIRCSGVKYFEVFSCILRCHWAWVFKYQCSRERERVLEQIAFDIIRHHQVSSEFMRYDWVSIENINRQLDTMSIQIELNRYDWISNILWILVCVFACIRSLWEDAAAGEVWSRPRLVATQKLKRSGHGSHTWVHIEDDTGDGCWDMLSNYWIYWSRIALWTVFISCWLLFIPVHCFCGFIAFSRRFCCGWGLRPSPQESSDDFTEVASQPHSPCLQHPETGYKQLDSNPRMPCLGRSGKAAGGTFGDLHKFQPLHAVLKVLAHVASSTLLLSEFEVWLFDILLFFLCYLCKWLFVASRFFDKLLSSRL